MGLQDFIVTPLYLVLIFGVAWLVKPRVTSSLTAKYYFPAIIIKISGAIFLGLIYQYYYPGGDTYNYFYWGSKWIWEAFKDSPILALEIIFSDSSVYDPSIYSYTSHMVFYGGGGADFVSRLAGLFALFTFNSYSTIAIFFALICFGGSWWFFQSLSKLYPSMTRKIALAIFLIPSTIVWGSGLLKDTLMLGAVCFVYGSMLRIFYLKKGIAINSIIIAISFFVIYKVKIYILLCLIPGIIVFIYLKYIGLIKSSIVKVVAFPALIILAVGFSYYGVESVSRSNERYSLDRIVQTAEATAWWHDQVSSEQTGGGYTLGDKDYSTFGILRKILPAINVTLFRPYPWEANSIFMLLSAFESLAFLLISLYVMFRNGLVNFIRKLNDPIILSMIVFSISFAFAIGAVTYNFGALVRYKVPILPVYLLSLILIYARQSRVKNHSAQA